VECWETLELCLLTVLLVWYRLGAWGKGNQVPRGDCFKGALDVFFGGNCVNNCSGIREKFQSCGACPRITNPLLIQAFASQTLPVDQEYVETQPLAGQLTQEAMDTQPI
jgi:hypothetical protein